MTKTAKLYGGSLYELAAEEALTESMLAEMDAVAALFQESPDYLRLLSEPSVPKAERIGLLDQAFSGQVQTYLLNFLKLLCENGTLSEFRGCCRAFRARYNEDHNIMEATVTSAVPLTAAQAQALTEKLEALSKKKIVLSQKTDASVLGGLRVEYDDRALDGTARTHLAGLRRQITESTL